MGRPRLNKDEMEAKIPADLQRKFPRACPREGCGSLDVRFVYFNGQNCAAGFTQPRYVCNACKKGFTRGGRRQRAAATAAARLAAREAARPAATAASRSAATAAERAVATAEVRPMATAAARPPATAAAKPAAKLDLARRHRLVMMSSSSSGSSSPQGTDLEAIAAEKEEARVEAAEEKADDESNAEGETGSGKPHEAQINPPAEMEFDKSTPAPSLNAKALLLERIKRHLWDADILLIEIRVEITALEASHKHRAKEEFGRPMNQELSAVELMETMQRDMFVAVARKLKAENGKSYEFSLYRYNLLRARENVVTQAEEAVAAMRSQVENMDIDRLSHSELVKMEKKARLLRVFVQRLDEC